MTIETTAWDPCAVAARRDAPAAIAENARAKRSIESGHVQLTKRPDVIDRLADGVGAELEPRQRAHRGFSAKLAQTPPQAGAAEIRALRNAGLTDIADLADAVAMFAWANRLMLTLGEPKRA